MCRTACTVGRPDIPTQVTKTPRHPRRIAPRSTQLPTEQHTLIPWPLLCSKKTPTQPGSEMMPPWPSALVGSPGKGFLNAPGSPDRGNPDPEATPAVPRRPGANGSSETRPGYTESRGHGQGGGAQSGHGTKGSTGKVGAAKLLKLKEKAATRNQ